MTDATRKTIENAIKSNKIVLFMKGTPDFPQCGFSAATVECLANTGAEFATVNVLDDTEIREGIKEYSSWPTIPQVYIGGEFIGGCDIVRELYQTGELRKKVDAAVGA
jgi:monothiol glutaredoxin